VANRLGYAQSIYYLSNPMTLVPSGKAVEFPSYTNVLDYDTSLPSRASASGSSG
jgi:hypothetical protein